MATETFPLLLHPGRAQLNQTSFDPNFYVWALRWWPQAITHGLNPLYSAQIGAPAGYNLAWVTSIPSLALLAWPVTVLAGPVVSFNLLVVAAVPASGWAAFVLCRRLTGRFWAALAGGAVYGFSAYELNHVGAGQLNLAFAVLPPLMLYLVLAWRDGAIGSRVFVVALAIALAIQFYLFIETFAELTVLVAVGLASGYWLAGDAQGLVARLGRRVGAAYLLAGVLALPDLGYALTHVPAGFDRDPSTSAVGLLQLIIPRRGQDFGIHWLTRYAATPVPAADGYIGIPLLLLAVAAAIVTWSSRLTRFLVVMIAVSLLAAFGPVLEEIGPWHVTLPWSRLWYLPLARGSYPARFMLFVFLGLAVITALWLARPGWRFWPRWLLAAAALAAIAANTPALSIEGQSATGPAFITTGEYRHYVAPGATVLVLSGRGNAGMLWQAETGFYFRIAEGFINRAITSDGVYPAAVTNLAQGTLTAAKERAFRAYLRKAGVQTILVDRGSAQRWPAILASLGLSDTEHEGVLVYRLTGAPASR